MSHNNTVEGYAAYKVADNVNYHEASMMGIYDVLVNTQGAKIAIANSIEVPNTKGIKVHHACNVRISTDNMGGFLSVINGQEPSTYYANGAGKRFYIVDYVGSEEPQPWERPTDVTTNLANNSSSLDSYSFYPNPASDQLKIKFKEQLYTSLSVSDISGRIEYTRVINNEELEVSLDFTTLSKGIHIVKLIGDQNNDTFKVIKK